MCISVTIIIKEKEATNLGEREVKGHGMDQKEGKEEECK